MRARLRAENQFKYGLWEKLLAASGIDQKELNARLAQDRRAVEKFLKNRKDEARKSTREVRTRHVQLAKSRIKRMTYLAPPPAPPGAPSRVSDILLSATLIDIEGGDMNSFSIAPYNNFGKIRLYHDEHSSGFSVGSFRYASVTWHFVWNPPRVGELNAIAFLSLNGNESLFCEPGCFYGGSASASVYANLFLTQIDPSGSPFTDASALVQFWNGEIKKDNDDSTGQIDARIMDKFDAVTTDQSFVIVGTNPVVISVELNMNVFSHRAQSMIDLATGEFAANAMAVILTLN